MDSFLYQIFKTILNIFKKKHGKNVDNPSIQIYVNNIENRVIFKIKDRYALELKTPKTIYLEPLKIKQKIKTNMRKTYRILRLLK